MTICNHVSGDRQNFQQKKSLNLSLPSESILVEKGP